MSKIKQALTVITLSVLIFGCDLKTFGPGEVSEKIMITDDDGNILGGNLDNWKEMDSVWLFSMLKPIYPNPTKNGICTLYVDVQRTIKARLEFDNGVSTEFYFPIVGGPHKHVINANSFALRNQLRHLNIFINDIHYTSGYIQFD